MAAPKWGGMLFGGRPSGGAETRRASAGVFARLVGNGLVRQTKQNPAAAGRGQVSLAVPERTGRARRRAIAQQAWDRQYQRDHAG